MRDKGVSKQHTANVASGFLFAYDGSVASPHRLTVRTPDFQSDNESSTLSGGTSMIPTVPAPPNSEAESGVSD